MWKIEEKAGKKAIGGKAVNKKKAQVIFVRELYTKPLVALILFPLDFAVLCFFAQA